MTKKIIDLQECRTRLVCYKTDAKRNPYKVYIVISPIGAPIRKRILTSYGDFMSVIYFIRDFFLYGLNTMCVQEMKEWIAKHSA